MNVEWVRSLRDQCRAWRRMAFWFKQWGPHGAGDIIDGRQWHELPQALDLTEGRA